MKKVVNRGRDVRNFKKRTFTVRVPCCNGRVQACLSLAHDIGATLISDRDIVETLGLNVEAGARTVLVDFLFSDLFPVFWISNSQGAAQNEVCGA